MASDCGFSSFWTAETNGPEAFSLLSAVAASTDRIALGTGVIAIQLRPPTLVAMAAATLQASHPERDVLIGIGVSAPLIVESMHGSRFGSHHRRRLREYATVLRSCLSGEVVSFDGDFYEVRGFQLAMPLTARQPRIVLAALNPNMLRLAGEIADGVLLNYLPASHVQSSLNHVRQGERAAGRTAGCCVGFGYIHATEGSSEQCLNDARRDLLTYVAVDSYAASFRSAGFDSEVETARALLDQGDRAEAEATLPLDFVDAINLVGDSERIRRRIDEYVDGGLDVPLVLPMPFGEDAPGSLSRTLLACAPDPPHDSPD